MNGMTSYGSQTGQAADRTLFRTAMGTFPTGVAVVSLMDADQPHGLTVNSFVSLSLDPPLVGISIDHRARSADLLERAGRFAINVVSGEQRDIAIRFATRGLHGEELYRGVRWFLGGSGSPVLDACLAVIECELHSIVPTGDHLLFLGEARAVHLGPRHVSPVVFHRSEFTGLRPPYDDHPFLHLPPVSPDWAMG